MTAAMKGCKELMVGMTALLGISCQGGIEEGIESAGAEESQSLALSTGEIDRILGFESVTDWHVVSGGQGLLTSSGTRTQGDRSLGVIGINYIPIQSVALTSLGSRVQEHIQYDVRLPGAQPNPDYFGITQVFIDCPSRGLYNVFVGQVEMNFFPLEQWRTVDMQLGDTTLNALRGGYSDLRMTVVFNVPHNATGTYLIDNLRFSATAAPRSLCDAGGYKPSPAGTVCRPASDACDLAETCSGRSLACPSDVFKSAGTMCRASAGDCDAAEACNGTSAACPADGFLGNEVVCRGSAGECDVAENCTGTSAICPPDGFAPATQICRPAVDACDVAEMCPGGGAACPQDVGVVTPTVTGLVATAGSGQVQLDWTPVVGASTYDVKRSTSPDGPFDLVTTTHAAPFADRLRAIGPTYYYVVTAHGACSESVPSSVGSATPYSSKTGTITPGPGGLKGDPNSVVAPTSAELSARYGSTIMKEPSAIAGMVGTGVTVRKPVRAALASSRYARVRYEIKGEGANTLVVPRFAAQLEGPLVPNTTVSGKILVVGRSAGAVTFVSTVKDPRSKISLEAPGTLTGNKAMKGEGGWLLVDLPEMLVASDRLLGDTSIEFYALSPSVPVTTPVSVASLPSLLSGSTAIARSPGSALLPILFPSR